MSDQLVPSTYQQRFSKRNRQEVHFTGEGNYRWRGLYWSRLTDNEEEQFQTYGQLYSGEHKTRRKIRRFTLKNTLPTNDPITVKRITAQYHPGTIVSACIIYLRSELNDTAQGISIPEVWDFTKGEPASYREFCQYLNNWQPPEAKGLSFYAKAKLLLASELVARAFRIEEG